MLDMFFCHIVGFDRKKKRPRRRGGLFGVAKAFIAGIEIQAKQTLHIHSVIYLAGFPRNCEEFESLCDSDDFRIRLESFIDSTYGVPKSMIANCPAPPVKKKMPFTLFAKSPKKPTKGLKGSSKTINGILYIM